jgi:(p)ppGpp synthase/HD superfamily hydrolase
MKTGKLVDSARYFATHAHGRINQERKYTGGPYIRHPERVAALVATVPHTPEMLAAAWLHDTVEDTGVTLEEVEAKFGARVADLVRCLTDCDKSTGDRGVRKAADRERLALAPAEAQTVKLADLIDNTESIVQYDPKFAVTYLREKALLLKVLTKGDATLHEQAQTILLAAAEELDIDLDAN